MKPLKGRVSVGLGGISSCCGAGVSWHVWERVAVLAQDTLNSPD